MTDRECAIESVHRGRWCPDCQRNFELARIADALEIISDELRELEDDS